ncbi:MAG: hypothetical protein HQK61_01285 [Desulfamplus sp.]|nr:hypothetical protein [Desulfamplus sp.]
MKLKRFLLYSLYGAAAFIFFLIILFPEKWAARLLCEDINSGFEDGQVVIEKAVPIFPPGLKAINPTVVFNNGNKIKIEFLDLYPDFFSFYKDVTQIKVKGKAYNGTIEGIVKIGDPVSMPASSPSPTTPTTISSSSSSSAATAANSAARFSSSSQNNSSQIKLIASYNTDISARFADLDIRNLRSSVENIDIFSSFKMRGEVDCRCYSQEFAGVFIQDSQNSGSSTRTFTSCDGSGSITLSDYTVNSDNILLKQMGINKARFEAVDIKWNKTGDTINLVSLNTKGADMKLSLKGSMVIKIPEDNSTLDFSGEFRPSPSHISSFAGLASIAMLFSDSAKKGIPFKIKGTLGNPRVVW